MKCAVTLSRPLPPSLQAHFSSLLAYCDPAVISFDLGEASSGRIVIEHLPGADPASLGRKVNRVLDRVISTGLTPPTKVQHQIEPRQPEWPQNLEAALREQGWVVELGQGFCALSGPAAQLFRIFDDDFRALCRSLDATEACFPSLLGIEFLNRISYFKSFPHYATFASHLRNDIDVIDAFMEQMNQKPTGVEPSSGSLEAATTLLSPTVCYHVYQMLQDTTLPPEGARITAACQCFRWESSNLAHLRRLWEFTMRELVLLGSKQQVLELKERALQATLDYCRSIGMVAWVENANDPFFSPDAGTKGAYQRGFGMKLELRLPFDAQGGSLAAASFNFLQKTFTEPCGIGIANASEAFSGCVGWGIERWVYAFVAQWGLTPGVWPSKIRERLAA